MNESSKLNLLERLDTREVKRLAIVTIALFAFMLIMQVVILSSFTSEQLPSSDAAAFMNLAKATAAEGAFYPSENDVYSRWLPNPGYINYLSLFYRFSQNDNLPLYGNIALTAILAFFVFYIAVKLFDDIRIGLFSVILFSVFPVNYFEIMNTRSDTVYTVLVFAAVAVIISRIKCKYILAGVIIALANFTRPMALSVFIAIILHLILTKSKIKNIIIFSLSGVAMVLLIGLASYISSGYFVYQSTAGGANLLAGANDDARGSINSGLVVFEEGKIGYIENPDEMTFKERNEFYTSQAVNWILENPGKYISLIPAKLFHLYATDAYAFHNLRTQEEKALVPGRAEDVDAFIRKVLNLDLGLREYVTIINQLFYMSIFGLAIVSLIMFIKKKMFIQTAMLTAIVVLGTGMTVLIVSGGRYHYPFLPVLIIFAGWLVSRMRFGIEERFKREKKEKAWIAL